jgi:hypothetical protein
LSSSVTIDIDSFVPRSRIDQPFFDTPYYVIPDDPVGVQAFAVIREAMRGKGMVALGRLVLAKRERVIALEPYIRGSWARRFATPKKSATRRIAFRTFRLCQLRRTCSSWRSAFSTARPPTSTRQHSVIVTRKPSSHTSRPDRPAPSGRPAKHSGHRAR